MLFMVKMDHGVTLEFDRIPSLRKTYLTVLSLRLYHDIQKNRQNTDRKNFPTFPSPKGKGKTNDQGISPKLYKIPDLVVILLVQIAIS